MVAGLAPGPVPAAVRPPYERCPPDVEHAGMSVASGAWPHATPELPQAWPELEPEPQPGPQPESLRPESMPVEWMLSESARLGLAEDA